MIIVDTREQKPIWEPTEPGVLRVALQEGDYTTTELINRAHIERKSGNDLYGSIIQGHIRFREELRRAQDKGLRLAIFVECPKEKFIQKRFKGGYRLKTSPDVLRKIITTIEDRYGVNFVWCDGREEFREQAELWFERQRALLVEGSGAGSGEHDIQGCDGGEPSTISVSGVFRKRGGCLQPLQTVGQI